MRQCLGEQFDPCHPLFPRCGRKHLDTAANIGCLRSERVLAQAILDRQKIQRIRKIVKKR
jgi:hypothetical protein